LADLAVSGGSQLLGGDSQPKMGAAGNGGAGVDTDDFEVTLDQIENSTRKRWWSWLRLVVFLVLASAMMVLAAGEFRAQAQHDVFAPSSSFTGLRRLSEYNPGLSVTPCNTEVYIFRGKEPGGNVLILGGTHPNEPAGYVAAVVLMENLRIRKGTIFVVVPANASGFSATEPQEATPGKFAIPLPKGRIREFRMGSRFTNPLDGWPDPDVYLHYPSKQVLSGDETRNLNRAYPGRANGSRTERVAYAITQLVKREKIDLVIDLHEASPEYPVVNAIVFHERAQDLAAWAALAMEAEGIDISLEPSPKNFHGLSHRELGDATNTLAVLMETACVAQGRFRGRTNAELVLSGDDPNYHKAAKRGFVRVPYPKNGIPLEVRVGRHLSGIIALIDAMGQLYPEKSLEISGIPHMKEVVELGVGAFLNPLKM
jgi:hypothetical protein